VKDSELIRDEITQTVRRIDETVDALSDRSREAGRTAATWGLVAAAAAAAIAGIVGVYVWRRRRSQRPALPDPAVYRTLPFDRAGMTRGHAQARPPA
jgi:hypothetical protein